MKRLVFIFFVIVILSHSSSFCTEGTVYNPPIPKPKVSIEKALEIFRAELKKAYTVENAKRLDDYIVFSIEYLSFNDIMKKFNLDASTMIQFSKEDSWEWIIKFSNTKISDDYQIYMVTQEGKVRAVEFCCL